MYIALLNLILKEQESFKNMFGGLLIEFCIIYPKWYNYDIITFLFHKNFDKTPFGNYWFSFGGNVRLIKFDGCACVDHIMINQL